MPDPIRSVAALPTQAVTVVQPTGPAAPSMNLDVSYVAAWAVAIAAIIGVISLVYKLMTRELNRDIAELRHKVSNVSTRVDALEHFRTEDIGRLVKVETGFQNIEKMLERFEKSIGDRLDTMTESIREVRVVAPRR